MIKPSDAWCKPRYTRATWPLTEAQVAAFKTHSKPHLDANRFQPINGREIAEKAEEMT